MDHVFGDLSATVNEYFVQVGYNLTEKSGLNRWGQRAKRMAAANSGYTKRRSQVFIGMTVGERLKKVKGKIVDG